MATINDDMLVERLVPKVLSAIRAKAKAVETIPTSEDLTGITSLPAYNTLGGQYKQVLVPLNALKEPALTEGEKAAQAALSANDAAERAIAAAIAAEEFAGKIVLCTEEGYNTMLENDTLEDGKLYFAYEPEEQEEL